MSYKVKSLIYLICFIASVLIYAQMDSSTGEITPGDNQLVQTQADELQHENDKAL